MKRKKPDTKHRRSAKGLKPLGEREVLDLSNLLRDTDPELSPSSLLSLLKGSTYFRGSSYAEGGAILLVAKGGHRAAYDRNQLRQIAFAAS